MLPESSEPEYSFGAFRLWSDGTFSRDRARIHLPPKELDALRFLLSHAGEVVTHTRLKLALWGDVHVTSDSVPRCLSSLRTRLKPEQCIQTIYKRGYCLVSLIRHNQPEDRTPLRMAIMPFAAGHNIPEHLGEAMSEEVTARLTAIAPFVAQFASTPRRDLEAVELSITTPWSNGPIEGHINRLKAIKRQYVRTCRFRTSQSQGAAVECLRGSVNLHRKCGRSALTAARQQHGACSKSR